MIPLSYRRETASELLSPFVRRRLLAVALVLAVLHLLDSTGIVSRVLEVGLRSVSGVGLADTIKEWLTGPIYNIAMLVLHACAVLTLVRALQTGGTRMLAWTSGAWAVAVLVMFGTQFTYRWTEFFHSRSSLTIGWELFGSAMHLLRFSLELWLPMIMLALSTRHAWLNRLLTRNGAAIVTIGITVSGVSSLLYWQASWWQSLLPTGLPGPLTDWNTWDWMANLATWHLCLLTNAVLAVGTIVWLVSRSARLLIAGLSIAVVASTLDWAFSCTTAFLSLQITTRFTGRSAPEWYQLVEWLCRLQGRLADGVWIVCLIVLLRGAQRCESSEE